METATVQWALTEGGADDGAGAAQPSPDRCSSLANGSTRPSCARPFFRDATGGRSAASRARSRMGTPSPPSLRRSSRRVRSSRNRAGAILTAAPRRLDAAAPAAREARPTIIRCAFLRPQTNGSTRRVLQRDRARRLDRHLPHERDHARRRSKRLAQQRQERRVAAVRQVERDDVGIRKSAPEVSASAQRTRTRASSPAAAASAASFASESRSRSRSRRQIRAPPRRGAAPIAAAEIDAALAPRRLVTRRERRPRRAAAAARSCGEAVRKGASVVPSSAGADEFHPGSTTRRRRRAPSVLSFAAAVAVACLLPRRYRRRPREEQASRAIANHASEAPGEAKEAAATSAAGGKPTPRGGGAAPTADRDNLASTSCG